MLVDVVVVLGALASVLLLEAAAGVLSSFFEELSLLFEPLLEPE